MIRVPAPAKINLTLAVLGKRPDGFHELESWVTLIDWHDEIVVQARRGGLVLSVTGMGAEAPPAETNLVWKAAICLAEAAGIEASAHVELVKRLPIGAGLGGGSSDAGSTLLALNHVWGLHWPAGRLAEVAAGIGSDVPLFIASAERRNVALASQQFILRGRGERLEALESGWQGWVVVVVPGFGIPTAEVYRRHAALRAPPAARRPWETLPAGAAGLSRSLFNDLEPAAMAMEPRLAELHGKLDMLGGRPVRMTGSGSCLFSIMDSQAEAEAWRNLAESTLGPAARLIVTRTL